MHAELINRVIGLVKKHGDKVVLMDEKTGEAVVVLGLESYEKLVGTGMGRDQLVQPISQPVAPLIQPVPSTPAQQPTPIAPVAQQQVRQPQVQQQRQPEERRGHAKGLTTEEVMAAVGERERPIQPPPQPPVQQPVMQQRPTEPINQAPIEPKKDAVNDEERFYLEPIE